MNESEYLRETRTLKHHRAIGASRQETIELDIEVEHVVGINVDCGSCGCPSVRNYSAVPGSQAPADCDCQCHASARFAYRGAAS